MRILLAGILLLLTVNAQGQVLDPDCDMVESPSSDDSAVPPAEDQSVAPKISWKNHISEPFPNPYDPASATNFDPFAVPLLPRTDMSSHSRRNGRQDGSGATKFFYGHFGDPLFPDSIANRGETAHPFAMDNSTNLFGRHRPVQGPVRR